MYLVLDHNRHTTKDSEVPLHCIIPASQIEGHSRLSLWLCALLLAKVYELQSVT